MKRQLIYNFVCDQLQGVCGQFAVYNSCYPSHYAQATSSLPVPQLFRKPTLNVGVRCGSPLRPQYSVSPTVKDRPSDEKIQPVPVYGFRVLPGLYNYFCYIYITSNIHTALNNRNQTNKFFLLSNSKSIILK